MTPLRALARRAPACLGRLSRGGDRRFGRTRKPTPTPMTASTRIATATSRLPAATATNHAGGPPRPPAVAGLPSRPARMAHPGGQRHRPASEQVEVEVGHGLAAVRTRVRHQPEPAVEAILAARARPRSRTAGRAAAPCARSGRRPSRRVRRASPGRASGAWGLMSRIAITRSSSWTWSTGSRPWRSGRTGSQRACAPPFGIDVGQHWVIGSGRSARGAGSTSRISPVTRSGGRRRPAVRRTVRIAFSRSTGSPRSRRHRHGRVVLRVTDPAAVGQPGLDEHAGRRSRGAGRTGPCLRTERQELRGPRLLRALGDLAGHPRRRRPGPARVAEDVEPGEIERRG